MAAAFKRFDIKTLKNMNLFQKSNKVNTLEGNSDENVSGKAFMLKTNVLATSDKDHNESATHANYNTTDENNLAMGLGISSVVTLRKSRTPIENMNLNASAFSFIKPNKAFEIEDFDGQNSVDDTFHRAVSPIIFIGQWFALLPVSGILHSNPKRLKFSILSLTLAWTLVVLCASLVLTITMVKHLLRIGITAKNFVGVVFFSCVLSCGVLFILLASRWPKLMRHWYHIESIFTQKPYEKLKPTIVWRIRFWAYAIIVLMTVEHGLSLGGAIFSYRMHGQLCASANNTLGDVSFAEFIQKNYDYVFEILPFNTFVAVFILIVNGACTFIWNYMDLFIMMVSKGIAYRFEQITTRINKLANKEVPESVFIEIREHYVKMCELLEYVDENLSGIILLSCINNLYFVCYQLLNVFNKLRWPINYIYFWYSLLYLIGRSAFVFLAAASINDQSKGGLAVLRRVSSKTWCEEVERLIFEMTTQTVALSGKKFYYLTRRLLIGMAGTIVTYELVLLQFDEPNRVKGLPDLCA